MEDFFTNGDQGETMTYQQPTQNTTINYQEQTFEYQDSPIQYSLPNNSGYNQSNEFEESQITRKIRQEQQRIQQTLKIKANQEYEEKQKRRAKASKQLEEFMSNREKEKQERKQQSIEAQEQSKKAKANESSQTPWKKVAANIKIKQGEYVGQKDVNRMREAILHKRDDES